jgi:hypothetical protein
MFPRAYRERLHWMCFLRSNEMRLEVSTRCGTLRLLVLNLHRRPPKGCFPPSWTDIQRPSSMMSFNESVLSRFIVEMSKTRIVYEILYVGQNHLFETTEIQYMKNFEKKRHSHSHPRYYPLPLRYPCSPHPVGLQSIRTCFFLPAFEKLRHFCPPFELFLNYFQNTFEKRSKAF